MNRWILSIATLVCGMVLHAEEPSFAAVYPVECAPARYSMGMFADYLDWSGVEVRKSFTVCNEISACSAVVHCPGTVADPCIARDEWNPARWCPLPAPSPRPVEREPIPRVN